MAMNKLMVISRLFLSISIGVLFQPCDGWADCHANRPLQSVTTWAEQVFSAPWADLPLYVREETKNHFDQDQDGWMSSAEQESVSCQMAGSLLDLTTPGDLVLPHGKLDWLAYLARQETISGYELKIFLGKIGQRWSEDQIQTSTLSTTMKKDLLAILGRGEWSVSEADLASQEDLLGVDVSAISILGKYLSLAYFLSDLKSKSGAFYQDDLEMILRLFLEQKNLPWLASVAANRSEIRVMFNQVVLTSLGEPGMFRFYLLQGVPVTLKKGIPPVWYQPSDQKTFVLLESDAYPSTETSVSRMREQLKRECASQGMFRLPIISSRQGDDLLMMKDGVISRTELSAIIQARVNQLSLSFSVPEIEVVLSGQPLKDGSTAYLDRHEKKISFSMELLQAVAREVDHQDFERHLNYLVIHEFLHWVQSRIPEYEAAFRLYNSPAWAHLLFGEVGYRRFYLGQPTERDAQGLASEYVRAATTGTRCQNWEIDPSFHH